MIDTTAALSQMETQRPTRIPITQKLLMDWAGPRVFRDGRALFEDGIVRDVRYEPPIVEGTLTYGNRSMNSQFLVQADGSVDNRCPCRDSQERGIICVHVIAMGMELVRRRTDPERERKAQEELRRAARLAAVDEGDYIQRGPPNAPGSTPAVLELALAAGWREAAAAGRVPLICSACYDGQSHLLDELPTQIRFAFNAQDENLLFVLEDIAEGPARGRIEVVTSDFINLLNLHGGKAMQCAASGKALTVNTARMASVIRMDLDEKNGELILMVHTELPFMNDEQLPIYFMTGRSGWVFDAENFWPLENLLPTPLQGLYAKPVCVERASVPRFMQTELPLLEAHMPVLTEITPDLFTIEPMPPRFRLHVRGSPASLAGTLHAEYPGISLVAGKADANGHFAVPDEEDILRYLVRDPEREQRGLAHLSAVGLTGTQGDKLTPIIGTREVLNFLAGGIPRLRRLGWKVELEGRIEPYFGQIDHATPVVRIEEAGRHGLFDVGFDYEDGCGESLSEAEIQRALLKGESFIEKNGRTVLIDGHAVETAKDVFADCAFADAQRPGSFRMDSIYAAYIQSSLDAIDGIDVEATPRWLTHARRQNRGAELEPVALSESLDKTLRAYQKEGVAWLRFLERNHCCGILADEMGLGKTLQTLAWLDLRRAHDAAEGKPALIVCPTSLVENWADEADRFVPHMKVVVLSGTGRHEKWIDIPNADMAITSYALMRRDIERYVDCDFSAVILDEAQHIKNRSTQNAVAAKRLPAHHRMVLTGTPIENSVSDLWSIMDFLMPKYLGHHDTFREHYERPISQAGPDGEYAQTKLRRKLHPFLLRRLKKDVAKDLPPKIERVAYCTLTKDQQLAYKQILEVSQRKLTDMVSAQGFNRSRMEILKTLLRLRQTCCHLDLLKLADLKSKHPSGKMDLFLELLDEAVDGGHRVLVFSQFTSMLAILRRALEERSLQYCYLDGSTKDRLRIVKTFNTTREIPAFLISLKAGGTGLNLTGADMVIHFDPWWNPAVEDQATDRAYRIGQQRTVYSVKLITRGTVEEKVLAMQKRKKAVIDATLLKDEQVMQKLTWDDVQELLSM